MNLPARLPSQENQRPTSPFSEPLLRSLRRAMGTVGGKAVLMTGVTISPQTHREIEAKCFSLRQVLTAGPDDRAVIGAELAKLLSSLPKQDPGVTAILLADAYREALGDTPAWAVREARLRIIRGQTDMKFAPSPPELVRLTDEIIRPLRQDLQDLEALAEIEPTPYPGAAERARVATGFDNLRAELAAPKTGPTPESDWAALEKRLIDNGLDPKELERIKNADESKAGSFRKLGSIQP